MSAQIEVTPEAILTVKISGKLGYSEFAAAQRQAAEILGSQKQMRVLVVAQDFQGWDKQGDWGDITFQARHDPQIARMAIVGDPKWQDLALLFVSKGFRRFPIEYFHPDDMAKARAWLNENA